MKAARATSRGNYIVREYTPGDYESVKALWKATGLDNPRRGDTGEIILGTISMGGCMLILEEKDSGNVCGTSWMTFDGRRILLHHFGILPEYQGNGLADLLLEKSLEIVKQKGFQVKLEVHRSNKKAVSLYIKHGFEYLGDYDVYIIRDLSKI